MRKFIGGHMFGKALHLCIAVNSASWLATTPRLHTKINRSGTHDTATIGNHNDSSCWTDLSDQNLQVNSAGNIKTSCDRAGRDFGHERTWLGGLSIPSIVSVQKSVFAESLQYGDSQ